MKRNLHPHSRILLSLISNILIFLYLIPIYLCDLDKLSVITAISCEHLGEHHFCADRFYIIARHNARKSDALLSNARVPGLRLVFLILTSEQDAAAIHTRTRTFIRYCHETQM